jgi:hypothetical protein
VGRAGRVEQVARVRPIEHFGMNADGSVDKAEQLKWWDAMDALYAVPGSKQNDVEAGLQMARECRHPDA